VTPEPTPGRMTALAFTPAPDPGPDPDGPAPAEPDTRVPTMAAEVLALTADRFAPTDDVLDLITWNTRRVTAAYGVTDQDLLRHVTSSAYAAMAFASRSRYGLAGIEPDGAPDVAIARHLARLADIPREAHHDLLTVAARIYRPTR
jgi:hypothetical protein